MPGRYDRTAVAAHWRVTPYARGPYGRDRQGRPVWRHSFPDPLARPGVWLAPGAVGGEEHGFAPPAPTPVGAAAVAGWGAWPDVIAAVRDAAPDLDLDADADVAFYRRLRQLAGPLPGEPGCLFPTRGRPAPPAAA